MSFFTMVAIAMIFFFGFDSVFCLVKDRDIHRVYVNLGFVTTIALLGEILSRLE